MTGIILKGVGGFYTLLSNGAEYVCKARGRFRNDGVKPLPGDKADFSFDGDEGYLLSIHERKNCLTRPAVANVDQLLVTIALTSPPPDFLLVDRLLIQAERSSMKAVLVVNKCDETGVDCDGVMEAAKEYAAAGYTLLICSAVSGQGLDGLRQILSKSVSALAGQSAVGKSSLINSLFPELRLKTGGLSEKTQRGKHTTRHAELLPLPSGGCIVDTPGFSLFETDSMEPEDLAALYPELRRVEQCRFPGCLHESEPDCAVKAGLLPENMNRYERYLLVLQELKEKRRHRFD